MGIAPGIFGKYLGNIWGIFGKYLGNIWGIFGEYLGNIWEIVNIYREVWPKWISPKTYHFPIGISSFLFRFAFCQTPNGFSSFSQVSTHSKPMIFQLVFDVFSKNDVIPLGGWPAWISFKTYHFPIVKW